MAKFSEWLDGLDYELLHGDPEKVEIGEVVYDSRKAGRGSVFVCMRGSTTLLPPKGHRGGDGGDRRGGGERNAPGGSSGDL